MGAISVGSIGLDCLANVERMRAKSRNLQGRISGKMRRDLHRTKEVINTLIYKSELIGDPTFLRLRNRDLTDQVEKLKLRDVFRDRELEEMRIIVEDMKKEISELRDKADEAEEDRRKKERRRKARESLRITHWKINNGGMEIPGDEDLEGRNVQTVDKETITEDEFTYLPVLDAARSRNPRMDGYNAGTEDPEPVAALEPKKRNEILAINKQMRDLVRRRAELKKQGKIEESETGGEAERVRERPLPQRAPRARPRVISDVRIAPPIISRREPSGAGETDLENRRVTRINREKDGWTIAANRRKRMNPG